MTENAAAEAVIYTRVSSAEQLREGFSIAAQETLLREYARSKGIAIVAEFSDDETAKTIGRPSFAQMVAYLKAHPGVALLVEKTDRLYRNPKDYLTLDDLKVQIHFVKEGGQPRNDSDSRFMHWIRVGMARKYVENLSEEVLKGMRQKAAEGGWLTRAPLGYAQVTDAEEKKRTGGMVPQLEEAVVVHEIFEAAATGSYTLASLAELARQRGLQGRNGAPIGKQVVANMLSLTAYYGEFEWRGETYRGRFEPLISRDLFEAARAGMSGGAKPKARTHTFAYAGIVRCGVCGGLLTGDRKKGRYVYYACRNARSCRRYYAESLFDEAMSATLRKLVIPQRYRDEIVAAIDRWYGDATKKETTRAARVRTRLTELQRMQASAYEEKLLGGLPEQAWRDVSEKWHAEEGRLRAELQTLEPRIDRERLLRAAIDPFELIDVVAAEYLRKDAAEKGRVVKTCCSNFLITDGSISIQLRSPFDVIAKFDGGQGWLACIDEYRTALLALAA